MEASFLNGPDTIRYHVHHPHDMDPGISGPGTTPGRSWSAAGEVSGKATTRAGAGRGIEPLHARTLPPTDQTWSHPRTAATGPPAHSKPSDTTVTKRRPSM